MIRNLFLFTLLLVFLAGPAFAQNPKGRKQAPAKGNTLNPPSAQAKPARLKKKAITPKIELKLPADFQVMSLDDLADEYPTWKKPLAAYTDPKGHADFIVTERRSDFPAKDLPLLQQFLQSSIRQMYSDVNFLNEKIQTINGRDYLVLEFTSLMKYEDADFSAIKKPIRKYSYLMYTIHDAQNKMTVFSFQTPIELKSTWENTVPEIMETIIFKTPKPDPAQQDKQNTFGK